MGLKLMVVGYGQVSSPPCWEIVEGCSGFEDGDAGVRLTQSRQKFPRMQFQTPVFHRISSDPLARIFGFTKSCVSGAELENIRGTAPRRGKILRLLVDTLSSQEHLSLQQKNQGHVSPPPQDSRGRSGAISLETCGSVGQSGNSRLRLDLQTFDHEHAHKFGGWVRNSHAYEFHR
jgi:hypothetical protein